MLKSKNSEQILAQIKKSSYICSIETNTKTEIMETKKFLTENREQVINYFNVEIKNYWNITLKDFMLDLMNNFEQTTLGEGLKRTDLTWNLMKSKSRLGLMDTKIEVKFDKDAYIAKKYEGTVFGQTLAL